MLDRKTVGVGCLAAWGALFLSLGTPFVKAAENAKKLAPEQIKLFETHVRPVLAAQCVTCHGSNQQQGELRLDGRAAALAGGESGPAVVPGQPDDSLLVEAIRRESFEMPPDEELSEKEIAGLVAWVKAGAPWPDGPEYVLRPQRNFTDEDRSWWCFQSLRDPPVPQVKDQSGVRGEVDRFILRRLQAERLTCSPQADDLTLLRRATFDLTGLPPTADQIDEFLADSSEHAYENLVDRLLASPRYGEHWARHWLDLVRYAESDGYRQDAYRPQAYLYRDYVIRSLNDDKPYDRFVMEQLAGDEIDPGNRDALVATMFLRHWIYEYNQRDVEAQWRAILEDITETASDVFLGLGMGCARCHDHKFDPILQQDYYRLQAFFAPLLPRENLPVASLDQQQAHYGKQLAWEEATEDIRRRLFEIEHPVLLKHAGGQGFNKFAPEIKAMIAKRDSVRDPYEHQIASLAARQLTMDRKKLPERLSGELQKEWETLQARLAEFDHLKPQALPTIRFVASDVGAVAPITFIPDDRQRRPIDPGFLTILDPAPARITAPPAALRSTGRRTALARWLTDPQNTLAARVMVNRVWQQHFGRGLSATPSDFGRLGEPPSHPELLDWLTRRFIESGWRLKPLHRLMMTSATYRQISNPPSTVGDPQLQDPANRLLWRMNPRRLSAEQIRDAMLAASGELDVTAGGPSVDRTKPRRSIYTKVQRNQLDPLLAAFDAPAAIRSTDQRNVTTTPTQALLLINSDWGLARARSFAARLTKTHRSDNQGLIRAAYRSACGRTAATDEVAEALAFLDEHPAANVSAPPAMPPLTATMPGTQRSAVDLQPAGALSHVSVAPSDGLPSADFTIEAIVLLRSLYPDATVRTIAAHWNNKNQNPGWAFGVTSTQSRYQPRNLILQLTGKTAAGPLRYEVVASNLRPELNKPYYLAAAVKIDDTSESGITFYLKDLSGDAAELQTAQVAHEVVRGYRPDYDLTFGGRYRSDRHFWDGLIDEVRLSSSALSRDQLLVGGGSPSASVVGHWSFEEDGNLEADQSGHDRQARFDSPKVLPQPVGRDAALVDFCHALLNSSEFLYVD